MSKVVQCDVCGESISNGECKFERRKSMWYEYCSSSRGSYYRSLDVCVRCWNGYVSYIQDRLAMKEPRNPHD